MNRFETCIGLSEINNFNAAKRDEICMRAVELLTDMPLDAIGQVLRDAMSQAVENGANSVSMPNHLVEIAAFLHRVTK